MKNYIGIKQIEGKPMPLGAYNLYRGWTIPDDENPAREGYLVKNPEGHETWSPKEIFEDAHREFTDPTSVALGSTNYTDVQYSTHYKYHAHNHYVVKTNDKIVAAINFQTGPVNEVDVNGCFHEDLINICIHRLKEFQDGGFTCKENACAITKLEEALHWLDARTKRRVLEGKKGTSKI